MSMLQQCELPRQQLKSSPQQMILSPLQIWFAEAINKTFWTKSFSSVIAAYLATYPTAIGYPIMTFNW